MINKHMKNLNCPFCSKLFSTPQARGSHQSMCKSNPNRRDSSGENNPMFGKKGSNQWSQSKLLDRDFDSLGRSARRRFLIEEANCSCSECGFDKRRPDGGSILEVDHIDGDPSNNDKSNLRVLCPNCHALTPTFRNWGNRGNKKHSPRLRKGNKDFAPVV